MKNKLLILLLGLLGFSACEPRMEYGSPYSTFKISGKVVDAQSAPIKGIVVRFTPYITTTTADDGSYALGGEHPYDPRYDLTFTDEDGPDNGGEFETKEIPNALEGAIKTQKGDGWYDGEYSKAISVVMEEKH